MGDGLLVQDVGLFLIVSKMDVANDQEPHDSRKMTTMSGMTLPDLTNVEDQGRSWGRIERRTEKGWRISPLICQIGWTSNM